MIKRLLFFLFLCLLGSPVFAQLEVKEGSFKHVEGFVNINTDKMYDDNDKPYAVLKIKTENISSKERHELKFKGDAQTFFEVEYQDGEIWLYISYYATYIKISHEEYSSTEFHFPYDMKPKNGYELTLVNKTYIPAAKVKDQYNYLIIKADQPNAVISIDEQYAGEGEASQYFKVGETHTWSIECNLYHPESGSATIVKENAVTIDKKLRPAFGYLNITSTPESGATVFIDNTRIGETPIKSGKLASGQHKVRVMKEMYATTEKIFTVSDGQTTEAAMNMAANYVTVTVKTDSQSDIYIDNEKKGKGSWTGRLSASDHFFEAKKASHTTTIKNATLVLGKDETIVIPDPTPIYGTLNVNTTPMGATITIDGKNYGTTPKILDEILVGTHEVKLEKSGMATITRQITLDETNMAIINEKLQAANSQNTQQTPVATTTNQINSNSTLNQGLIAYYPFDGNANDMSGNGNHATPKNNYNYENGVKGQAIHLTGKGYEFSSEGNVGGYVSLPKLNFGNEGFTMNIWVKAESLTKTDGECYIGFGDDGGQEKLYILQNTTQIFFKYRNSEIQTSYNYKGQWTMYTITCSSNGVMTAYVNGNKVGEKNVSYNGVAKTDLAAIGKHWWSGGRCFSTRFVGSIDEVRLYNRPLNTQEINELYRNSTGNEVVLNKTNTNTIQNTDGLIAYYTFDGNANDMSGNGNHATPKNNYNYENGHNGQAIHLTGKGYEFSSEGNVGGYVSLPNMNFGNAGFTINIWVKAESLTKSDGECYIGFGDDGGQEKLYILQNTTQIFFKYRNSEIQTSYNYKGQWTMYTITCSSNGVMTAYVNGNKVGEKNVSYNGVAKTDLAAIGRHWWSGGKWFSTRFVGSIDEVRLYNKALTAQEVLDLFRK